MVGSSTNKILTVPPFTVDSSTYCTHADVVYTFSNTGMTFISFNSLSDPMTFDWGSSAKLEDIGEYTLTLMGKISRTSPRPDI